MTALGPAFAQGTHGGGQGGRAGTAHRRDRGLVRRPILTPRPAIYPKCPRDLAADLPEVPVRLNGLPEGTSLRCGLWRCVPLLRRAPRGDRGPKRRALCLRRCGRSAPPVRRPRRLQGIADVVPQLEPIRDPERVRRGLATSQRIGSGSLTGQDGSPGLALHPRDPGLGGACLENGDGLATFPSNDHGAVGRAAASGERIAPQDPRCDSGTRLGTRSADERIRTAPIAKQLGDARRHLGYAPAGSGGHPPDR